MTGTSARRADRGAHSEHEPAGVPDRPIARHKAALIDLALERYDVRSIVDLGGCWGVNGGYTFHALQGHRLERAVIVDGAITKRTRARAARFPQVELISGSLGDASTVDHVGQVDAAIMYDILLHQVAPDWDELLGLFSGIGTLIIFNQNWIGPTTLRFVELGVDEYIRRVPHTNETRVREWFAQHDEMHPQHHRPWRDVYHFWQWGITQKDLTAALWDLGYAIDFSAVYGPFDRAFPEVELVGLVAHKRDSEDRFLPGLPRIEPVSSQSTGQRPRPAPRRWRRRIGAAARFLRSRRRRLPGTGV